ncbi:MAG: hypothetical protein R3F59_25675 [Myxococcota bacterium]
MLGVYDTKYRDLWARPLTREILYQMSIYALAWRDAGTRVPAVVLYATQQARPDQELHLRLRGDDACRIVLRGVDWARAARCVQDRDGARGRTLAAQWVTPATSATPPT